MRKYINNISSLQFSQLLRFSNLLLIGVIFSKLFSTEIVGYYEKFIFVGGIVTFFWLQGIIQAFLSLVKDKATPSSVYFNTTVLLLVFSVFTVLLLFVFRNLFPEYSQAQGFFIYFKWLVPYLLFGIPSSITEYIYLAQKRYRPMLIYSVLSQGLHFLLLIIPVIIGYDLEYALIGLATISILRFVWLTILLKKHTVCQFSLSYILKHLKIAYPLIFSVLLSGSASYIDGLMVSYFFDDSEFAIYKYGAKEFPVSLILVSAFSDAILPEFKETSLHASLLKIKNYTTKLMHLLFPTTLFLLILSNLLFPVIFSEAYAFSAKIFNVYLLLIVFRIIFSQTILLGVQKTKVFIWVALAETITNIVFNLLFINAFGLLGVAYATLVAFLVENIILVILVKKYCGVLPNSYLSTKLYSLYSTLLIASYIIIDFVVF